MNWYLLQTKPNAHLTANVHLKNQGLEVFLPLILKTTKRRGKFVNNKVPLFPGYLFFGTKFDNISWKSVNATRGVSKAVSLDGNYRVIDSAIIDGIKSRCDKTNTLQDLNNLKIGDRIKIERGPFADFICKLDKIEDGKRAWVLIDILQKQTKTKVSISDLSNIS